MKYSGLSIIFFLITISHADIVMGVVPQQSPLKLLKAWTPITKYLSDQIGEKVIFKTEKSIPEFEKALYEGVYDFSYMNPFHFIIANKLQDYQAAVRASRNIRGILVKKKSSVKENGINKNSRILFPSPNAFAATLLIKYDLIQKYDLSMAVLNNARYVNSHDSVYKGVSRGIGDIGGGIERTFNNLSDKNTKNSLKIIHTTKGYPSHPFAFHPRLSNTLKKKLVDALISMPKTYLKSLNMKVLKVINNDEYKGVEKLAIKLKIMPK